jgi:hypothetical protein
VSIPVDTGLTYDDLASLSADDVHRLDEAGHHPAPTTLATGHVLTCLAAPGFELPVTDVLA